MQKRGRNGTLKFLDAVSDGLLLFELSGRYRYAYMRDGKCGVHRLLAIEKRRDMNRRLDAARRRGLISESRLGKRLALSLTEKGRETMDRMALRAAGHRKDGLRVYVMYDIPERCRASRNHLRTLLKRAGFRLFQRSVWRSNHDVATLLKSWVHRHKLGAWVDVSIF